jgi:formylglycine-generating enzyme required for sulfatase activity
MTIEPPAVSVSVSPQAWRDAAGLPLMIELPPGEFWMGESDGDRFANDTERPAHRVHFESAFAIGCYPVLVGEFRQFRPDHSSGEPLDWPVALVSWHDAVAYCQWLNERAAHSYRLPSEAEWEYTCRAGSSTPFAGGHGLAITEANYLYDESGIRVGPGGRTSAGSYSPNAFGVCDLHGNVAEWTQDIWHGNYHGAPEDGRPWVAPDESRRVIRGGAWDYLPRLLRSSWRDWQFDHYRADNLGFRVVADCSETPVKYSE